MHTHSQFTPYFGPIAIHILNLARHSCIVFNRTAARRCVQQKQIKSICIPVVDWLLFDMGLSSHKMRFGHFFILSTIPNNIRPMQYVTTIEIFFSASI